MGVLLLQFSRAFPRFAVEISDAIKLLLGKFSAKHLVGSAAPQPSSSTLIPDSEMKSISQDNNPQPVTRDKFTSHVKPYS